MGGRNNRLRPVTQDRRWHLPDFEEGVIDFVNPNPSYEFQWHLGAMFSSIIKAGLQIRHFQEYPYFNAVKLHSGMQEREHRHMYLPDNLPELLTDVFIDRQQAELNQPNRPQKLTGR